MVKKIENSTNSKEKKNTNFTENGICNSNGIELNIIILRIKIRVPCNLKNKYNFTCCCRFIKHYKLKNKKKEALT